MVYFVGDDENEDNNYVPTPISLQSVPTSLPLSIRPLGSEPPPSNFQPFPSQPSGPTNLPPDPRYTAEFVSTSAPSFNPPYHLVGQMSLKDKIKPEPVVEKEAMMFGRTVNSQT